MRNTVHIPKPSYPWPTVYSPISETFYKEESIWYDTDYGFMSPESIKRYKKQRLVQVGAFMSPTTSDRDIFRPIGRFAVYVTIFDDYVKLMPLEELKVFRDRIFEVMTREDPHPGERGILRQIAAARKEWLANGMPQFWIDRIATNFHRFITYGIMEEILFKQAENRTYPLLAHYLSFRKYSIGMWPYGDLIDPAVNYALPVHIYNHPIIQRCRELLSLIIVIQNDFASLKKELEIENESLNIIFILRHQYKISYQEACTEAMKLHDAYAQELDDLHQSLPDFGSFQEEAYNHVYHIKLQISGCADWYYNSGTSRYEHKAFIVPQYGREGDDIVIPHSIFIKE